MQLILILQYRAFLVLLLFLISLVQNLLKCALPTTEMALILLCVTSFFYTEALLAGVMPEKNRQLSI